MRADHPGVGRGAGGSLERVRELVDALSPPVLVTLVLAVTGAVVVASGVAVTGIVDEVIEDEPDEQGDQPDDRIMSWVVDARRPALTSFFRAVTRLGDGWFITVVVVVAAGLLLSRRRPAMAVAVAVASGGASLVTSVVKGLVQRQRPEVLSRLVDASGHAFPSGHSSMAIATYGAVAVVVAVCARRRVTRIAALVAGASLALLVGASRVYLGVHWPSDVLSGWIVGGAWLVAVGAVSWVLWRVDRPSGWWGDGPPP